MPPGQADDLTIALDGIAHRELASRQALLFDDLESWQERSAAEHRSGELITAIGKHPVVAAFQSHGYSLIDFATPRLRLELARLLRGWTLARVTAGVGELVCDPGTPAALLMGLRAGLGLDPATVPYSLPPALPGSRLKRALMRPPARALAAVSRPERVRIAAVIAGKLTLALAALPDDELRGVGIGAMPFPGLDHGNGALFALRRRLPLLATNGPRRAGPGTAVRLPERLGLEQTEELDRAVTLLVGRLLAGVARELEHAIAALAGLERTRSLRALVLPNTGYGASRLLIAWAHARGLRVGALQHGIYTLRNVDAGEQRVNVIFGWGEATVEQTSCWPDPPPPPPVLPVGVPGVTRPPLGASADAPPGGLRRVLIATSDTMEVSLAPVALCESFVDGIAPALARLTAAGVELKLRPHPTEDPARYRRQLDSHGLSAVAVAAGGSFAESAAAADILISSFSSVAFEAAGLGLPVLMWSGGAPLWVRREHHVVPWSQNTPGMFETGEELDALAEGLLERPAQTFAVAHGLARRLASFAEPFRPERFAEGLRSLVS